MTPATIGAILLALVGLWVFGGLALRIGGLLIFFAGTAGLIIGSNPLGILAAAIGAGCWLSGHWLYAFRHQEFKSPLARQIFGRWAPSWLDPTRDWSVPTTLDSGNRRVFGDRGRRR